MEEGFNQKLLKEKENSLLKLKAEKDRYSELFIEKNELENEFNKLNIEFEQLKISKTDKNSKQISKIKY